MFNKYIVPIAVFILILATAAWMVLQYYKPTYHGTLKLKGLSAEVEVIYDTHGVPHIYAESERDAHFALGFVHAQDRLFQMEMIRRVASGRLAEILGPDLVETDQFFRTIGLHIQAQKDIDQFWSGDRTEPWQMNTLAYLDGINAYIARGRKSPEFYLAGIPTEPFTLLDVYLTTGFMSFGFAEGFREDPLITGLLGKLGEGYLKDLTLDWPESGAKIPVYDVELAEKISLISAHTDKIMTSLPVAPWLGSNSWVVGPSKSATGGVLFANDTHMGYSQPTVWYEAHLEAPGLSSYGNYAAGFPFPILGHNRFMAVGLTMFENDDTDFFILKPDRENPDHYLYDSISMPLQQRIESIKVKGGETIELTVKSSHHGPIVNEVIPSLKDITDFPVAVSWSYTQLPNQNLQATYRIFKASKMEHVREGASLISSPGLNMMYGDVDGNIAWWTTAKLWDRPAHQSGKFFLDGSLSAEEPLGFLPFDLNPHAVNPPWGYVYSANNQPEGMDGRLYPGYYVPENRARRIQNLLEADNNWTVEKMKAMINDVVGSTDLALSKVLISLLDKESLTQSQSAGLQILEAWDGSYSLDATAPAVFQKWIYLLQDLTYRDEMGDETFKSFMGTHLQKRSLEYLVANSNALWWDNVSTTEIESREMIVNQAFSQAIDELVIQLGADQTSWTWDRIHTVEHPHPFNANPTMGRVFNVGPIAINGGNEIINNVGFKPDSSGYYKATFGPAMRRIIDLKDIAHSWSVLPTGQSGHLLSSFYSDQAQMYAQGKFRGQWMDRADIEGLERYKLRLQPD